MFSSSFHTRKSTLISRQFCRNASIKPEAESCIVVGGSRRELEQQSQLKLHWTEKERSSLDLFFFVSSKRPQNMKWLLLLCPLWSSNSKWKRKEKSLTTLLLCVPFLLVEFFLWKATFCAYFLCPIEVNWQNRPPKKHVKTICKQIFTTFFVSFTLRKKL